jgi:hypothetical protein
VVRKRRLPRGVQRAIHAASTLSTRPSVIPVILTNISHTFFYFSNREACPERGRSRHRSSRTVRPAYRRPHRPTDLCRRLPPRPTQSPLDRLSLLSWRTRGTRAV